MDNYYILQLKNNYYSLISKFTKSNLKSKLYKSNKSCTRNIYQPTELFENWNFVEVKLFKIIGHARCGSEFISHTFQQFGFDIPHEMIGEDGICSWLMTVNDFNAPWNTENTSYYTRYHYIIHYIRNPQNAIPSIILENAKVSEAFYFRRNHILRELDFDIAQYKTPLERAIASFLAWNKIAELQVPDLTLQVEDCIDTLHNFLIAKSLIRKTDEEVNQIKIDKQVNNSINKFGEKKPEVSTQDYQKISPELKTGLISFCKNYGYDYNFLISESNNSNSHNIIKNARKINIAHIINPVKVDESSDLFIAQPITFATMINAKAITDKAIVNLYSTQYVEDESIVPDDFIKISNLKRSILDIRKFTKARKLPLIKDILDDFYQATPNADYLIYTNSDISLQPNFYNEVIEIINQGYDAFVINRRTISDKYTKIEEIPLMYEEKGESHLGHDCFVFKRNLYPKFQLGLICIGMRWIGRALYINCLVNSNNFKEFEDLYLTFHIGDNRTWSNDLFNDYVLHNKKEIVKIMNTFKYNKFNNKLLVENYIIQDTMSELGISYKVNIIDKIKKIFSYEI